MAIKTIPSAYNQRQVLRKTWLNQEYWTKLDIVIHTIFLMGTQLDPFGQHIDLDHREFNAKGSFIIFYNDDFFFNDKIGALHHGRPRHDNCPNCFRGH